MKDYGSAIAKGHGKETHVGAPSGVEKLFVQRNVGKGLSKNRLVPDLLVGGRQVGTPPLYYCRKKLDEPNLTELRRCFGGPSSTCPPSFPTAGATLCIHRPPCLLPETTLAPGGRDDNETGTGNGLELLTRRRACMFRQKGIISTRPDSFALRPGPYRGGRFPVAEGLALAASCARGKADRRDRGGEVND
ncbi:hypothetical protein CMUS01_02266 [Colletotrichum musicola]|uniref:Uncharacterized protein n=1 Tax=Colletotrichum musicola TaxID=2175873 RepID=A0A8H6NVE2_9PEZI|nr:hypothetical protein CMUS01_02266 [Colletotrichum musicola]